MAARALTIPGDAVVVSLAGGRVDAVPKDRLVYWPVPAAEDEAPASTFAAGEELEFVGHDSLRAAAWFRALAVSVDPAIRAGALVRLARNLRKLGQVDAALTAYRQAARISNADVAGAPADLLARSAECDLLSELHRASDLQTAAGPLRRDLLAGRWQIDRAAYEADLADTTRWTGGTPRVSEATRESERLSAAVEWLWDRQQRAPPAGRASGRDTVAVDGALVTILWLADAGRLTALVAGPAYVQHRWLASVSALLQSQGLRLDLRDPHARVTPDVEFVRTASESGLPWTIAIENTDLRGELDRTSAHRTVWLAGLAVLLLLVLAGAYVVARAVTRELAVARLQSDFVAAVSHEFRTPLTTLRQLTEVLVDERVSDEGRRKSYYHALQRQAHRLDRLVESLLDFGRMEAGTSPYRRQELDLIALIRETVDEVQGEVLEHGFGIDLRISAEATGDVLGDRDALKNAIRNLLDNAVKYSPECRTVWVTAEQTGGRLHLRVRDQGLGIPAHEHQDIFRKFVRGAQARDERIKGTGIGLAMVRHIVHAHGGEVSVESAPGQGSTFTVTLPLGRRGKTPEPQNLATPEPRNPGTPEPRNLETPEPTSTRT
jgi:signal transduction histidine kinase